MSAPNTHPVSETITDLDEQDVLAWVLENPDFLVRHAAALAAIQPEAENVTPLHAFKAVKAEKSKQKLEQKQQRLLQTVQANSVAAAGVFAVVPQLVRCQTLPALRKFLQTDLCHQLDLAAVRLFLVGEEETANRMSTQAITALLADKPVHLRTLNDAEDRALYGTKGKMYQSDALLALQDVDGVLIGLLALASTDAQRFHAGQGDELARFFAEVVGAVLSSCLHAAH